MADPKYANLPGIDLNSPDVYETSELPEDDQGQIQQDESSSENIEHVSVNASAAYGKFKGKTLDASGTDFSDKVTRVPRTGYDIPRTEYEMVGDGSDVKETPQQKYQRLQHEIRELAEEVTQVKQSMKADASSEALSPIIMAKQVEYIKQQLTDLHLDELLGATGTVNLSDPQGALQKRLLSQLEGFRTPGDGKTTSGQTDAPSGDGDHVTYQLYYRPEQAKFSNNARVADLEQRLERMEALIGSNPEKVSYLTADTSSKTLLESVALLSAKSKLLESSHMDQIEGRLHMLGQKLNQLGDKKNVAEKPGEQNKVSELYEIVKKWNSLANTLPHIVDRLSSLKDLHEQALQFSQALAHLDTAQQQIKSHLDAHGDMVKEVKTTLADNMDSIKTNFGSLDTRITSLNK